MQEAVYLSFRVISCPLVVLWLSLMISGLLVLSTVMQRESLTSLYVFCAPAGCSTCVSVYVSGVVTVLCLRIARADISRRRKPIQLK